jgi:D-sedoheptulose 7-phosphate isomerase
VNVDDFFRAEFDEHEAVARASREALAHDFAKMLAVWATCIRAGGKILFFGNGGSAADAQHLATELGVRYKKDRAPIAALALTTDTSTLTGAANDLGFDSVFSRQIEALGKPGDVAFGITTSGRSGNVISALKTARSMGLVAAALSGGDAGALPGLADPLIVVPSATTARIQELHILLGQMLCGALEIELGLV